YFPDPDLLPLEFDQAYVDDLAQHLPELPDEKKARFVSLGLTPYEAGVAVADPEDADYFEKAAEKAGSAKLAWNWVFGDLAAYANSANLSVSSSGVNPAHIGTIVHLIQDQTISGKIAKDLLQLVIKTGEDPTVLVDKHGMKQVTDTGAIEKAVDEIIAANPDKVEQAKAKPTLLGWFVGQVMKQTGGKANPQAVNEFLNQNLGIE
ncbi:MAG: Asp-tRNA(Asn)/Glu-tRNA(Gln) amidotransferase GatCAB subunit B, partial [Microvirga sp.]